MGEIFISYSSKDEKIAEQIYSELNENGFSSWLAKHDIPGGGDYASLIEHQINKCKYFLVIVSKHSCNSQHVQSEISLAVDNNKKLIPFRLDNEELSPWMRYYISRVNWIQATEDRLDESIEILIESLKHRDNLEQNQGEISSHFGKSAQSVKGIRTSSAKSIVYEIQPFEIEKTSTVYVPFQHFNDALEKLQKERVLLLYSQDHSGKYSTSITLLKKSNVKRLYQILPTISEKELLHLPFENDAGYIIDNLSPESLKSITSFTIKKLTEKLNDLNTYLILTINERAIGDYGEYVVKHNPPIEIDKMLENHFVYFTGSDKKKDEFNELIGEINLIETIKKDFLPRDSELLTKKLIDVFDNKLTKDEFIDSLKQNVEKRVNDWFEVEREMEQYALICTLAIFNESRYSLIESLFLQLKELFELEGNEEEDKGKSLFHNKSLEKRLDAIGAELYTDFVNTNIGMVEDKFVRFKTKEDASAILRYIWVNYADIKILLLSWFERLIEQNNKGINRKINQALVEIFKEDPLTVMEIISDWANDRKIDRRLHAVDMLIELSAFKENIGFINKLLSHWSSLSNNDRLQWTAAAAYGTSLGILFYPNSLIALASMLKNAGGALGHVIFDSMESLFLYGKNDPDFYLAIPYLFDIWLEEIENQNEKLALLNLFFALLANIDRHSTEILLTDEECKKEILPRWIAEGLANYKTREFSSHIMKSLFKYANGNPLLQQPLRIFTFSLFIKGGDGLKNLLFQMLKEILQEPYKDAAIPIVKEIIKLEGKG